MSQSIFCQHTEQNGTFRCVLANNHYDGHETMPRRSGTVILIEKQEAADARMRGDD